MATTGVKPKESTAFRRGVVDGRSITPKEREAMLQPFLPEPPTSPSIPSKAQIEKASHKKKKVGPIRSFAHFVIYHIIAFIFSVFFRFRRAWRLVKSKVVALLKYHHRTPEFIQRDVKHLDRLPQHLSVILDLHDNDEDQGSAGLEGLVNDVCEIAAWTASAGIPYLSVYEKTGRLKSYIPQTHRSVSQTLEAYFGARRKPSLSVRAPHQQSYSPPLTPPTLDLTESNDSTNERQHLALLLLSREDGRDTLIDLTKTLADMAQHKSLKPNQIDSNLIDSELRDAVSTEPDLLILFSPRVVLEGYPPWQLRLTEIFHLPDNNGVNYQVFLRALHKFAKVEMRLGR
ncbi:di-trans,poly-cis-decaprenylcistransferase [Pleomassaria siparia CBS 279.74]|uniref:ditrans,polycis-polyprenyl diphosphate synthase [(2E,6E)-farnesyldiphosphate specific] n=1 Tax=Pleomassaria siparia CBS 279.74 TaxID=1314801 RepID=A0A6G1JXN9_9PLEO|nr:di-trans,poly-cis-decaprenylcistransferase [Pleomassaria siparia CBS 279.74]